jgi:hypothetical protein
MPFFVVSLATDAMKELREVTFPVNRAWCEAHGYTWVAGNRPLDPSRPASWSKIRMIQELCHIAPGQWAFWIDGDAVVTRPDWRLEALADDDAELIIAKDHNGMNCGVFLIRLGNMTWNFLADVYSRTEFLNHRWWEQAAIRQVLEEGYPFRVKYADKTLINANPDDFVQGHTAVLHVPNAPKIWPDRVGELKKRLT